MVDHELIRKAAEAMWKAFQGSLDIEDSRQIPFGNIGLEEQKDYLRNAAAALKVFYEHTQSQTRERKPPCCADCGSDMTPARNGTWRCLNCGSSTGSV